MVNPAPEWGLKFLPDKVALKPSDKEISMLLKAFEREFGKDKKQIDNKDDLSEKLSALITNYRSLKVYGDNKPSYSTNIAELEKLELHLKEVLRILDGRNGMNDYLRSEFLHNLAMSTFAMADKTNPIEEIKNSGDLLLGIIKSTRHSLKFESDHKSPEKATTAYRKILAWQLSNIFEKDFKVRPMKTRGGLFDRCYIELLQAMNYKKGKYNLSEEVPEDTYHLIKAGIDYLK